ncbi:glycine receptor subunit alpha-1-like [Rhopilema esculentum]|uniref:glycine receptor subunit alpha-1-like n=1 Tax=Rhopilema esculentum TaxID=499914 RepID=UPI0031D4A87A
MMSVNVFFVILCLMIRTAKLAPKMNTSEISEKFRKIFKNYDKRILPSHTGEPVNVSMQFYVVDMVPIKRYYMHMDVNLFVRQFWRDHRLDLSLNRSEWKAFGIEAFKDIWVPEVYFPAAKKGKWHDLMKPNTALHIHHGGEIFLSRGASQTIYCPMDLRNFPFDQQRCQMDIRLYAYDNKHCTLDWNLERGGPIFVNNDLQVSEFSVKSIMNFI